MIPGGSHTDLSEDPQTLGTGEAVGQPEPGLGEGDGGCSLALRLPQAGTSSSYKSSGSGVGGATVWPPSLLRARGLPGQTRGSPGKAWPGPSPRCPSPRCCDFTGV